MGLPQKELGGLLVILVLVLLSLRYLCWSWGIDPVWIDGLAFNPREQTPVCRACALSLSHVFPGAIPHVAPGANLHAGRTPLSHMTTRSPCQPSQLPQHDKVIGRALVDWCLTLRAGPFLMNHDSDDLKAVVVLGASRKRAMKVQTRAHCRG